MAEVNADQQLVRRFLAAPDSALAVETNPVARDVGMVLQGWDPQRQELTIGFRARDRHVQGNGAVQGGIVATMLDFALVFPVLGLLEPPRVAVTVSLNLQYERPLFAGELQAVARINRLGGRVAFTAAEIRRSGEAEVLARATATLAIV